jgi:hypothetical protein
MTNNARLPRVSVNVCNGLKITKHRSRVNETVSQALIELATDSINVCVGHSNE